MPPAGVDALAGAARDLLDQAHVGVDRQVVAVVLERGRRDHDDDVVARRELGAAPARCAARSEGGACRCSSGALVARVPAGGGLTGRAARAQADVLLGTALAGARAARVEAAAARERRRVGRLAGEDRGAPAAGPRARARRDGDQRLRVRVLRALEHVGGAAELDHAPEVHDGDAVAERPREADVVRDQEQREPARAPQPEQQMQHLRAHGDVERARPARRRRGPRARARARWRSRRAGAGRPTARADSGPRSARRVRARRPRAPSRRAGCARLRPSPACAAAPGRARPPCMRGLSDWYGSWNTIWSCCRIVRTPARSSCAPSKRSSPPLGCSRPSSVRASVVLPQPDSPTTPSTSFWRHSRSTPSSARTIRPPRRNCTSSPRASTSGVTAAASGVTLIAGPRPPAPA